jgi:hypothetical protein
MPASTAALKNWSRWSFGNGLPRILAISGSRRPLARKTRNAGAERMNGWSGIRSAIAVCSGLSTMTMSAC